MVWHEMFVKKTLRFFLQTNRSDPSSLYILVSATISTGWIVPLSAIYSTWPLPPKGRVTQRARRLPKGGVAPPHKHACPRGGLALISALNPQGETWLGGELPTLVALFKFCRVFPGSLSFSLKGPWGFHRDVVYLC